MNAGRKANRQEAEKEFKAVHSRRQGQGVGRTSASAGGDGAHGRHRDSTEARLASKGLGTEGAHLIESAAAVKFKNNHKKNKGEGVRGEWFEQSYDRDVRRLAITKAAVAQGGGGGSSSTTTTTTSSSSSSSSSSKTGSRGADRGGEKRALDYGRRPKGQTASGIEALAADIIGREAKRAKSKVSTAGGRDTQVQGL
jgi:hypothetical protein